MTPRNPIPDEMDDLLTDDPWALALTVGLMGFLLTMTLHGPVWLAVVMGVSVTGLVWSRLHQTPAQRQAEAEAERREQAQIDDEQGR